MLAGGSSQRPCEECWVIDEYLWNELLIVITLKTVESDFRYIILFAHSFKPHVLTGPLITGLDFTRIRGAKTDTLSAQGAHGGGGLLGKGKRLRKRQNKIKAGNIDNHRMCSRGPAQGLVKARGGFPSILQVPWAVVCSVSTGLSIFFSLF